MIEAGHYYKLKILRRIDIGLILGTGEQEVLLPKRYSPRNAAIGDVLEVFIYRDSRSKLIATTLRPFAKSGDIAYLKAVSVNRTGLFVDIGLAKDLLIPYSEQTLGMTAGKNYWIRVYTDNVTGRLVGSAKIGRYVKNGNANLNVDDEVRLLIYEKNDLGYKVIINNAYWGLLYNNEIFQPLKIGQAINGYVKKLRDDEKVDVSLQKQGYRNAIPDAVNLLEERLISGGGFCPSTIKAAPKKFTPCLK